MAFIKEEREDIRIEEAFTVKHEDIEEQQTEMVFIIDEMIEVKREDTEKQTGWFHSVA